MDNLEGTVIGTVMIDGSDLEALNNGTNVNVTTTWTAVSGSQTIYVDADSTNLVDESIEKNELSKTITVDFVEPEPNETPETTDNTEETTTEKGVDSLLPSLSLLAVVTMLGMISILRRR